MKKEYNSVLCSLETKRAVKQFCSDTGNKQYSVVDRAIKQYIFESKYTKSIKNIERRKELE